MDPNETLKLIESETDPDELMCLIYDLKEWLAKGGAAPQWDKCLDGTKRYNEHMGYLIV